MKTLSLGKTTRCQGQTILRLFTGPHETFSRLEARFVRFETLGEAQSFIRNETKTLARLNP